LRATPILAYDGALFLDLPTTRGEETKVWAPAVVAVMAAGYVGPPKGSPGDDMAVKFLSQEWADAVTTALNSSEEFAAATANQQARLQQIVTGGPGGDAKYYFTVDDGEARVGLGEVEGAEATITQTYDTAVAISKRELSPQQAFMQGRLRVHGNLMKLLQLQDVLSALGRAIAKLDVDYRSA
jgi:putative sterol carrier protein